MYCETPRCSTEQSLYLVTSGTLPSDWKLALTLPHMGSGEHQLEQPGLGIGYWELKVWSEATPLAWFEGTPSRLQQGEEGLP